MKHKRLILDVPSGCHKNVKLAAEYYGVTVKDFIYNVVRQHIDQCAIDDENLRTALIAIIAAADDDEYPVDYKECTFEHPHILPWHNK